MKLAKFILSNQVEEVSLSRPVQFSLDSSLYYHSTCKITSKSDLQVFGFGVSKDQNLSQIKAFMESLERKDFAQQDDRLINSSASGFLGQNLKNRVILEAIERDALLRWCLGLAGHRRVSNFSDPSRLHLEIYNRFQNIFTVISIKILDTCCAFGTACSTSLETAIKKADEELVFSLVRHQDQECETGSADYNRLHGNTSSPKFKEKIRMPSFGQACKKHSTKGLNFAFIKAPKNYGPLIRTLFVKCNDLLVWDTKWILGSEGNSSNNSKLVDAEPKLRSQAIVSG